MIGLAATYGIIYACGALGLIWAMINYISVKNVELKEDSSEENQYTQLTSGDSGSKIAMMKKIGGYITDGANAFLFQEYKICGVFIFVMGVIIKFAVDTPISSFSTACAFWIGCVTSMIAGFIGMRVAVFSNYRTAYVAQTSLPGAFKVAFKAGCVMGFALSAISLIVLVTLIIIYRAVYEIDPLKADNLDVCGKNVTKIDNFSECPQVGDDVISHLFEAIAGYGLGGSTIALFGRVGGGIYTKAADVGADLVGKVEQDLPEDSPRNPATIADNVGDNVGDIAGMGSDLFGSFAESTCAALVIIASAPQQRFYASTFACGKTFTEDNITDVVWCSDADAYLLYPLTISALSLVACILCAFVATNVMSVDQTDKIERTLRFQLIIASGLLAIALYLAGAFNLTTDDAKNFPTDRADKPSNVTNFILPNDRTHYTITDDTTYFNLTPLNGYLCTMSGMVVGLLIGLLTEYYTSNAYKPVQEVSESCKTGAATNIIYGLALGYLSTVLPVILLGIAAYISHKSLGLFGIALAALGMLSNLAVSLAVDAYGPISDNAGGIAEMAELGEETRHRTDALDAAGNTTAAIGKGFAIGSAAFVSLALYGAFITRSKSAPFGVSDHDAFVITDVQVTDALLFSGLLIGAMLPYAFSAMTMKSVGEAALQMVQEIRKQLNKEPKIKTGEVLPDYNSCVAISTQASLREMIAPGALVIVTPLAVGLIFGPRAVAGLLPGALVSGVQMAISSSNTGGAWDNAKKYIESGQLKDGEVVKKKGSDEHKAAVIGDTVGDPLKDTSGPALNILVKLSAILSLVFAPFFQTQGWLVCPLNENPNPGNFRKC